MNNDLRTYIKENLSRGVAQDTIKNTLLAAGWKDDIVTAVFAELQGSATIQSPFVTPTAAAKVTVQSPQTATTSQLNSSQTLISAQKQVNEHTILQKSPMILLRIGLAFVFIYASIAIYFTPQNYEHFIPAFISSFIPVKLFFTFYMLYEVALSLWLLSGKKVQFAGFLAALTLIGITLLNLSDFNVLFRNVAIIFAAIALGFMGLTKESKK